MPLTIVEICALSHRESLNECPPCIMMPMRTPENFQGPLSSHESSRSSQINLFYRSSFVSFAYSFKC